MSSRKSLAAGSLLTIALMIFLTGGPRARDYSSVVPAKGGDSPSRVFVLDGSGTHNVGQLQMHTGNWGVFGSFPGSSWPTAAFPSAQWPANSGVEYLFISGLWVGARKGGIPSVSTSAYEIEFRPTDSPEDRFYHAVKGDQNGIRLPYPGADDDGDGAIDEDYLDGYDNDGDGLIDEDFAAISDQMFSCWFTDDQPGASEQYEEHQPLHLLVRQESYQWKHDCFDDFVGIKFTITNTGTEVLEDIYIGLMVDGDAGSRTTPKYWEDDGAGRWAGTVCTELGPASVDMAYTYDFDGDGGLTPGYLGFLILGHTIDPLGLVAPKQVGTTFFKIFEGSDQPYENGGDPTNDFERYEVMSRRQIDRNKGLPGDYRVLVGTGPFAQLPPGGSMVFYGGFVAGLGLDGLIHNAAHAQRLFDGLWFDLDDDPQTGVDRRETPVTGPASGVVIDECRPEYSDPIYVPARTTVWINADCAREDRFADECGYEEEDSLVYWTGVAGGESQVHWILERPEPPPPPPPPDTLGYLDIRPGSCPNPFNLNLFRKWGHCWCNHGKKAKLPVAILGGEDFDVRQIDISTVRLEGVAPEFHQHWKHCKCWKYCKYKYEDVSQPAEGGEECACTTAGPDGYLDLKLKFSSLKLARALREGGIPEPGETRKLTLTGKLLDGTEFEASDCVIFVGGGSHFGQDDEDDEDEGEEEKGQRPILEPAYPNPFNPVTTIAFYLPENQRVRLEIFDVSGRLVKVLIDGERPAGDNALQWDARGLQSGIYFYRLRCADFEESKKIILLR
ncbi:MAG: T9SS type A sorting domain-containing protein [Candidatus Krumholzibacteriota bacterium]|nr:T9SS type A sorting domain-containing protein [Candidatus Krumholzibacteriota bacterium]